MKTAEMLRSNFNILKPHLNEKSIRLWAALEAKSFGRGGVTLLHEVTGLSRSTITRGIDQVKTGRGISRNNSRQRRSGGGRKTKELRLRKTSLSPLAVKLMADGLTNEQFSLSLLDLSENNIGDKGVKALANTLQDNRTLKELVLDESQIGTTGARVLAYRVATSGSLEVLSLPNNKVRSVGAVALASSLKYKKNSLRVLDLRSNDIEDAGAVALANALRNNTSLKSLNLYNNCVYADGVAALASTQGCLI